MATNIRGMTIEIGADTSKFDKVINRSREQLKKLDDAMREINSLLKKSPSDKDLYSQAFTTLNKQIEVSKERLVELRKAYKILEKDFKDGKVGQGELLALQREIKATEQNIRSFEGAIKSMGRKASNFAELSAKVKIFDEKIGKSRESLKKLNEALKLDPKNVDLAREKQALLTQTINETRAKLAHVKLAQEEALKEFNKGNLAREEYAKIKAEVTLTTEELKKLTLEASEGYKKLNQMGDKVGAFGDKANSLGNNLTMKVTAPIAGMFTMATKEAVELESAMAGVHKTTDMTEAELSQMKDTFIEMSKHGPVAAKDLANIGEMAGQLGIKKENIAEFAKTISDLTIATNLTKEQAAMDLSRFINITQMSQDEVGNLASAIVDLGNKFETNETEITEMGLRLAAQGKIIGLTGAEIMGVATALSAAGLKAEQGGSAFSRVMYKMNASILEAESSTKQMNARLEGTGLSLSQVIGASKATGKEGKAQFQAIAKAMNMSEDGLKELIKTFKESNEQVAILSNVTGIHAEDMAESWRKGPTQVLYSFLEGMANLKKDGKDLSEVFKGLGMNNIREIDTVQRLALAHDKFADAIHTSTDAYEKNTALAKEVGIFAETNAARFEQLKNNMVAFGLKMADTLLPVMESAVDWLMKMADKASKLDPKTIELWVKALLGLAALGPIVKTVGMLSKGLGGILKLSGDVAGNMKLLKDGFDLANAGTGGLSKSISTLAFKLGPKGLLVAAIVGGALWGFKKLNDHMKKANIESDVFGDEVSEGTKKAISGFLELDREATGALNQLKASGDIVSKETVTAISGHFGSLGGEIAKKVDEKKEEAVGSIRKMYEEMGAERNAHHMAIESGVERIYTEIATRTEEGEARVKEILETASNEKRALTEEERVEIDRIQTQMRDDGIKVLSESEKEYAVIRQRMKDQAGIISAEQAAKLVQDSVETKNKTIAEAEEEYATRIGIAEELRAQGTKESAKLADEIIKNAQNVREKTIKDAEERHRKIVEEAKGQAKEHVDEVNWETGEILSKWEIFHKNLADGWDGFWEGVDKGAENFKKGITKAFSDTWGDIKKDFDGWKTDMKGRFDRLNEGARRNIDNIVESFKKMPGKISEGISNGWNRAVKGLHDLFVQPFKDIVNAIKRTFEFTLPRPKLPHIRVNWQDIGLGISLPSFGIDWYKKGAIFTKPTLFDTPYGMKGVGEAGPEAVLPIEKLSDIFVDTMAKLEGSTGGDIYISGNEFIVRNDNDIELIAKELQKMIDRKRRGLGL